MNILQSLKSIWERITDPHGPLTPVPEVRRALEAKGYRYEFNMIVTASMGRPGVASWHSVKTASGHPIDYYGGEDPVSARYRRDYDDAVTAYKRTHGPR